MGLFGNKDGIVGAALGASGAFDKNKKTDKAAAFGAALGASIGSGKQWTMEDSIKLNAAINALDSTKANTNSDFVLGDYVSGGYIPDSDISSGSGYSSDSNNSSFDDILLSAEQEAELEEAGIDVFDFENMMDDDERLEALEDAGLDPWDFDVF